MALDKQKLVPTAIGKGVKVWTYSTTDTKATVKGANYFDGAATLLTAKDRILINASDADFDCHVDTITAGVVVIAAVDAFV